MLRTYAYRLLHGRSRAGRLYKTLNNITLSRAAVLHNVDQLQKIHPGQGVIPVLKSNAYGHGLQEIAAILNDADCAMLAVDGYFEAAKIRHITKHRILVLGYILPSNAHLLDVRRCSFVVQDTAGLHALGRTKRHTRIHMELNTGMNRLGLQPDEIDEYLTTLRRYPNLELEGIITHLADADNEQDNSFTHTQITQFDALVDHIQAEGFRPKIVHVAQTAGSAKAMSRHANALRLGIGLYGVNPLGRLDPQYGSLAQLMPVLELKSTIIKAIDLKPGAKVSYNGIFTAKKPMRIGVLPLGYYEGVPRELSNRGVCTSGGQELPIVGRVCMNHTMIDITNTTLSVGDPVTVISRDVPEPNTVARLSAAHHVFPYSLLTGLSSSVRREIV